MSNQSENFQNKFKTTLFELDSQLAELKLPDENESESIQQKDATKNENLHGKWVVVNGNFIKPDQKNPNLDQSIEFVHLFNMGLELVDRLKILAD